MINPKKVLLLISSFPATGIWFAWYFDAWKLMIICLGLAVPIMIVFAYYEKGARMRIREITFIMFFYLPLIIYAFAKLYESNGLLFNGEVIHSFSSSLYFSIVTWTTLGYGDYQPTEPIRLWASAESFFGYIFMAILIGLIISFLSSERKNA